MRKHPRLLCSVTFFCCALFAACQRQVPEPENQTAGDTPGELTLTTEQQEMIGLTTVPAVTQVVRPIVESFGRVIPRLQGRVLISSPVAGQVTAQSAERIPAPGTFVHKGQILAEIEQTMTASERVQLDVAEEGAVGAGQEAKAALDAAAIEYQRSQNLFQAKVVSRKRVEEAKATWLQAQSRYDTARRQENSYRAAQAEERISSRHFTLTAPITGTLVQVDVTAGQQVDTTTPLLTIADLSTVWIEALVFEGDLDKINTKSPVVIRRSGEFSSSQPSWVGSPIYASVVIDQVKRTAGLLYEVKNLDGQLKLGMSVTVALPAGPEQLAVMAPEASILENGNGKGFVYVRRTAGVFAEEEVALGIRRDGLVAIAGDVRAGDELVVTGAPELFGKGPGRLLEAE
jgi:membrane fusion protein, heavy metal efflux system